MFSFFLLLYRNHTKLWCQNRGTNQTVMFVYRYTPNKYIYIRAVNRLKNLIAINHMIVMS